MRLTVITIALAVAVVATACSSAETQSTVPSLTEAELAWCGDPDNFDAYNAIWEEADRLGVDSMGNFMLDKAGVETDIDPKDLEALSASLSREEIDALVEIGNQFDESDDLWLEYLDTPAGTQACRAAYTANS